MPYEWNTIEIQEHSPKDKAVQDLEDLLKHFSDHMNFSEAWRKETTLMQSELIEEVNDEIERLQNIILEGTDMKGFIDYTFTDPHSDSNVAGYEYVNPILYERDLNLLQSSSLSNDLPDDPPDPDPVSASFARQLKAIFRANEHMPVDRKCAAISRFSLITGGLVLAAPQAVVASTLMRRAAQNKGDSDILVSKGLKESVHAFMRRWAEESDASYWARFAGATELGLIVNGEKADFTLADHVFFMNLTIELSPMQRLWSWDEPGDVLENVQKIKSFYDADKTTLAGIYRHVLEATYQGEVMPRAVAAKQLQFAFSLIAHELQHESPARLLASTP